MNCLSIFSVLQLLWFEWTFYDKGLKRDTKKSPAWSLTFKAWDIWLGYCLVVLSLYYFLFVETGPQNNTTHHLMYLFFVSFFSYQKHGEKKLTFAQLLTKEWSGWCCLYCKSAFFRNNIFRRKTKTVSFLYILLC